MGCIFSCKCDEKIITPTCDVFRDTPLRYLGYAAHVGNACSMFLPKSVANVPHMLTTAYITGDVLNKTLKSSEAFNSHTKVAVDAGDAIIWQALASVIIPGFIISKIKQFTIKASTHSPTSCAPPPALVKALPGPILKALPCILGILAVPLLKYPIDKAVDILMDSTYRPMFNESEVEEIKMEAPQVVEAKVEQQEG